MVTGYPTSGKTYRSKQLYKYFTERAAKESSNIKVHHLTDSSLSIARESYSLDSHTSHERSNNSSEKDSRALVFATVKRLLTKNDVVILDAAAGNYIKGWRYQLYCEAKAVRTPHCLVHVGTPKEKALEINQERLTRRAAGEQLGEDEAYEPATWENLVFRYEEPNGMSRWDSPLFTVLFDDDLPPCEAIWDALIGSSDSKPVVRPNAATISKPTIGEGFLHQLDRGTQDIIANILQWGKDHEGEDGGEIDIIVSDVSSNRKSVTLQLPARKVGTPELQRLRRQFISLNRQNAVSSIRIKESFVEWLNDSFQDA